jgi:hypothetical protein
MLGGGSAVSCETGIKRGFSCPTPSLLTRYIIWLLSKLLLDNTYSYRSFKEVLSYQIDTLQAFKHSAMAGTIDEENKAPLPYPDHSKPARSNSNKTSLSETQPDDLTDDLPSPPSETQPDDLPDDLPPPPYEKGEASDKGEEKMGSDRS